MRLILNFHVFFLFSVELAMLQNKSVVPALFGGDTSRLPWGRAGDVRAARPGEGTGSGSPGAQAQLPARHHRGRCDTRRGHDHRLVSSPHLSCSSDGTWQGSQNASNLRFSPVLPRNSPFHCSFISSLPSQFPSKRPRITFSPLVPILLHPYPNLLYFQQVPELASASAASLPRAARRRCSPPPPPPRPCKVTQARQPRAPRSPLCA